MTAGEVSGRLSLAVVVATAAGLGLAVSEPVVVAGVVGALGVAWGVSSLEAETNTELAAGSLAVMLGVFVVAAAAGLVDGMAARVVAVSGSLAVLFAALLAAGDGAAERLSSARGVLRLGLVAACLLGVLSLVGHAAVVYVVVPGNALEAVSIAYATGETFLFGSPLLAFVTLQVLAIASALLFNASQVVVRNWLGGASSTASWEAVEAVSFDVGRIPDAYWVLFALQVLFLLLPDGGGLLEWVLSSLWLLGDALRLVLLSGVVHVPLLLFVVFMSGLLLAEVVRPLVLAFFGDEPGRQLAVFSGGVVVAVAVAGSSVVYFGVLGNEIPSSFAGNGTAFGVGAAWSGILLLAVGGLLVAVRVACWYLASFDHRANAIRLAGVGLFVAALATEGAGGPPLAVFAGVAASLVAWDLGGTAVDFSSHLGEYAETRRAEVVHATGTLGVGVAAVLLATAAIYLVGPLSVPRERAGAAVLLALLGALGLLATLSERETVSDDYREQGGFGTLAIGVGALVIGGVVFFVFGSRGIVAIVGVGVILQFVRSKRRDSTN